MYTKVITSALFFSISFLFAEHCGFLILLFWVPLMGLFNYRVNTTGRLVFFGFVWGLVAYGLHFIWLFDLLIKKSHATLFCSISIYSFIVFYAALTSATCFLFLHYFPRMLLVTIPLYFILLDRYMFWFLGKLSGSFQGYSFLNPLLPLMQYKKLFAFLLSIVGYKVPDVLFMPQNRRVEFCGREFVYIEPTRSSWNICKNLDSQNKDPIFVGPETTFQFPLNKKESLVRLWFDMVPDNSTILLGSLREEEGGRYKNIKRYQTVYHLSGGLIISYYDKTLRVPFSEKVPKWWSGWSWSDKLFLKNQYSISRGQGYYKNKSKPIFNLKNLRVRPLVCSELFDLSRGEVSVQESDLLIAFVNDSWFCQYFRNLMVLGAILKAWWCRKPLLYVGHLN